MSEKIWLVDRDDQPVGEGWQVRSYVPGEMKNSFRTVYGFVRNGAGRIWFPFRNADRPIFPLCYEFSVAGTVIFGETYEDAIARETLEETGIDFSRAPTRFLGQFNPFRYGLSSHIRAWEILSDQIPYFNRKLFNFYMWVTPDEFRSLVQRGIALKPDLAQMVDLVYPIAA